MLNQKDIDQLMLNIQSGAGAYLYYIAHRVECRETHIDEYQYKSAQDFRVLKLKVNNVSNAYFAYLDFIEHPEDYHTEQEEAYNDEFTKYVYYYTVPNIEVPYTKDLNPRVPSMIFGLRRKLYKSGILIGDYSDPSPIKPKYTNNLEYGNLDQAQIESKYEHGDLDWKYMKLRSPLDDDGILYNYITSNWYILDIENFPRVEKPLINTEQKTAYFINNYDAQSYLKQLKL